MYIDIYIYKYKYKLSIDAAWESCIRKAEIVKYIVYRERIEYIPICRDVNVFIFQKNDRFVMKTTTKIRKRNDRFLKC